MRVKVVLGYIILVCIIAALIGVLVSTYTGRVPEGDYDAVTSDLLLIQQDLDEAEAELAAALANLTATDAELQQVQAELDDLKDSPVIVDVYFEGHGGIARVKSLKFHKYTGAGGTYYIECELEQAGTLPPLANVVDVELYIQRAFIDSVRWIDVTSSGFTIVKPKIRLDTGSTEFVESITLKFVPAFKTFGTT
ncbi:MAG TPA: hypothetical protein G4O13_00960 [Dehalococcoidia bacterium]|nr:hypothetical protein [Dehalococcoidia bacterium]